MEALAVLPEAMATLLTCEKGQERRYEQEMVGLPFSGFDPGRDGWWAPKQKESLRD